MNIKKIMSVFLIFVLSIYLVGCNNQKEDDVLINKDKIKNIIDMFSRSIESTLVVTSEGTNLVIQMYDSDNKLLTSMNVWKSGYFGFMYDKEYFVMKKDIDIFKDMIDF